MFIDTLEFNTQFSPIGIQNFYVGEVVDNADPKKLGRVKVKITELYGDASKEDLPWVTSFVNSPHEFNCPEIGDKLVVFFPYGIIYFPCYIGHWHLVSNHDSSFDADYPDTIGFNRQGFSFLYNKKAKTLSISHPSGSTVSITDSGDIAMNSVSKFTVSATGEISFSSDDKVKVNGAGGVNIESDAEVTVKGKSKTTVGDASSQTFVNGVMVLLAGGGVPVAVLNSQTFAVGNLGAPVIGVVITGSSKVQAPM